VVAARQFRSLPSGFFPRTFGFISFLAHDGRLCCELTFPSAELIETFRRLAVANAGYVTEKKEILTPKPLILLM